MGEREGCCVDEWEKVKDTVRGGGRGYCVDGRGRVQVGEAGGYGVGVRGRGEKRRVKGRL